MADLPHAQGQVAPTRGHAQLCGRGCLHDRGESYRHSRQRHDKEREGSSGLAMARGRKSTNQNQLGLLEARVATAPLVPGIREKVKAWRDNGYKGTSETTRILLNHWFHTDHRLPQGRKFKYHYFQCEAVETLVYLYEVAKV